MRSSDAGARPTGRRAEDVGGLGDGKVAGSIRPAEPDGSGRFLEDADRIGRRLVAGAEWAGERCTWTVRIPDRSAGRGVRRTIETPAGPDLYRGAVGIALFLAELYRLTGDERYRRAAACGVRHALAEAKRMVPGLIGFHSGRVGVAYAAARVAECLDAPELLDAAWKTVEGVFGRESADRGLDVIAGSAGALLALLALAGGVLSERRETLLASAERMGERLIAVAHVEPVGWSWATIRQPICAHNLTGYAHGASGVAHALAELYRVTGSAKYRYAARQGFGYERRWYDPERKNWPDFRHTELGEWLLGGGTDELRAHLRSGGTIEPFRKTYMTAWCHGAPGIGLARLRGWRILGDAELAKEARAAVETTAASLRWPGQGHSLCHGGFGNAETLLAAAEVLGEERWRAEVEGFAEAACAAHERAGRPWRSGTLGALPDPSLMLGDAGVGHVLLRLQDPSIPAVLCLDADGLPAVEPWGEDEAERLREAAVDRHFAWSRRAFRVMHELWNGDIKFGTAAGPSSEAWDVTAAYEELAGAVERETAPERRSLLERLFRPERVRYERARDRVDATGTFLKLLVRDAPDEINWKATRVRISPGALLVEGLLVPPNGEADAGAGTAQEATRFVVCDRPGGVELRPLGALAAVVLAEAADAVTAEEIAERVADRLEPPPAVELLTARVVEQLASAYRAGIIDIVQPEDSWLVRFEGIKEANERDAPTHGSVT